MFLRVIGLVLLSFTVSSTSSSEPDWSYFGSTGPQHWSEIGYPDCGKTKQSPIDIREVVIPDVPLPPIQCTDDWDVIRPMSIIYNGHTVKVTLDGTYRSTGGMLPSEYVAEQLHFHWGSSNDIGSEHTIAKSSYPAEMHIVHYSSEFNSVEEAMESDQGLAVFAFFISLGEKNTVMEQIVKEIKGIEFDVSKDLESEVNLLSLVPLLDQSSYWTYNGSLTTPPCYESVVWTIFQIPIVISVEQLEQFRSLNNLRYPLRVVNNFRPPTGSSSNDRQVVYQEIAGVESTTQQP
ncbi:carbonic anhydrase 2-like isoform X2 [Antedon mediterranea]|uniref:carbonic anhydrase 2-like isoform X2 n=1 Tax=Antedon mediterranea TaxID=105859 RepID=UPI003AF7E971